MILISFCGYEFCTNFITNNNFTTATGNLSKKFQKARGNNKRLSNNRTYRGADKSLARPRRKQATPQNILSFIYPIYNHNWRNISAIYIQGVTGGKDQTSGECSLC